MRLIILFIAVLLICTVTASSADPTSFITITAPVPGHYTETGVEIDITWEQSGYNTFRIEYSPDSGASWSLVAEDVPASGGRYPWTPSEDTLGAMIRISSKEDETAYSVSDDVFFVQNTFVDILSPEPGSVLSVGDEYVIEWRASSNIESIRLNWIYSSLDGDIKFYLTPNSIPAIDNQCAVKVPKTSISQYTLLIECNNNSRSFSYGPYFCQQKPDWQYLDQYNSPLNHTTWSFAVDGKGGIWIVGDDYYYLSNGEWNSYQQISGSQVIVDQKDRAWFYGASGRITCSDSDEWILYDDFPQRIRDIAVDKSNNFWVLTENSGLYYVDTDTMNSTVFNTANSDILSDTDGWSDLVVDNENALWIAYNGGGVQRLRDGQWTNFSEFPGGGMTVDHQNTIWIAEYGGDDKVYSYDGNSIVTYPDIQPPNPEYDNFSNLMTDNYGAIWFGCEGGAISYDGTEIHQYTFSNSGINSYEVSDIQAGNDDSIIFLCSHPVFYSTGKGPYLNLTVPDGGETWGDR